MKKINVLIGIVAISSSLFCQSQTSKTSVMDDAGVDVKAFNARQAFLAGDINKALKLYSEANTAKPNDGPILYRLGQCYYALEQPEQAINYFERAESLDSNANEELHLTFGLVYLQDDQVDKALFEFNAYKRKYTKSPEKLKNSDIDHCIAECILAKQLEASPVNVTVKNAGDMINSQHDEKSPSVTADGTSLIFTSSRPLLVGNMRVSDDPSMVFDNVYICKWDSGKNTWGGAYPIDGDVNEAYAHTSCTSISPDGNYIYLYKNNVHGASRGGDIYVSKKSSKGRWGAPVALGKTVNSSYYEDGACLSPDGNTLYFTSERPGGYGLADLYKADRISKTDWAEAENLGPVVNSGYDEGAPFMAPDGRTLFFSSDGHNSMGGYDIFKTSMNDSGKWTAPVNLGYPINTVDDEKGFTISADARMGYIASNRKGGEGKRDIYLVNLSNYSVLSVDNANAKPKGYSILRGKVSDSKGEFIPEAHINITDSAGAKISNLSTNADGIYFITLKANVKYKVKVAAQGYKGTSKAISLPDSPLGTFTMQQDFILEKE